MSDNANAIPLPLRVAELLRRYPPGRITGCDPGNPPEVERAFRVGYMIGVSRCTDCNLHEAADLEERLHRRRCELYHDRDVWSDRRAALLRGAMHGVLDAVRARAAGVRHGLYDWLDDLRAWSAEEPMRLDWASACPPAAPEEDGPPLGRDGVPRRLWREVFGAWTMLDALAAPVTAVRQRGPFIESTARFEKRRSQELGELRARLQAFDGEITGLEHLAEYPADVQAVIREELAALAARTPGLVTVRLSDVHPELVRWLWPGRMALGKLTLLCGDPGLGKSFITLDLAARVSSGTAWPDLPLLSNPRGSVVLLSAEDDLGDTIRPRLDVAGADASRIVAIRAVRRRVVITGKTQEDYFDLNEDLPALEAAILKLRDCRLVIIDPLTAYLGKTDSHKNAEVRAVLARLFELAAQHRVAVLAVTHLNKASTLPAIYRAMGSLAFVAAARAVWAVVRDDEDETGRRRLFVPIKNNLGADETGLAYALEATDGVARVVWESGAVNMRADDALGGGRKAVVRDDATQFVIDTLNANGGDDMLSDDLWAAAKAEGISRMTLRRAKEAVVESYKEKGRGGRWRCRLKDAKQDAPDPLFEQVRTT